MLNITDSNSRVVGGREISIPGHKQASYFNICSLQTDLNLVLLEVLDDSGEIPQKRYTLTSICYRLSDQTPVTPLLDSLEALDDHIEENMNEIVQGYLFGFVEEDLHLASLSA